MNNITQHYYGIDQKKIKKDTVTPQSKGRPWNFVYQDTNKLVIFIDESSPVNSKELMLHKEIIKESRKLIKNKKVTTWEAFIKEDEKANDDSYQVFLPSSGTGKKEIKQLLKRRPKQLEKAIKKLQKNPTDFRVKGIEKLSDSSLGEYSIRVSRGDRLFYDVNLKKKIVYLLRAGKHDIYKS